MWDDPSGSLIDVSKEWKAKADQALVESMTELSRGTDRQAAKTRRTATRTAELTSAKLTSTLANLAREMEEDQQTRQEWAKKQITELNDQNQYELESLEALRQREQELFQAQLSEKNETWRKAVLEKREEAVRLRSQISFLSSAISVARNEAKTDIDEARRRASESAKVIRASREEHIREIADLTSQIQKEKSAFEIETKQLNSIIANTTQQKREELARQEATLTAVRRKVKDKEKSNEAKFRQQCRVIRDLGNQLQQVREAENQKQDQFMQMRKMSASLSRDISARKNEAASLKRQLAMIEKDNQELQAEIMKLETQLFPEVFKPPKL
jgi:hypothetical protein